MFRWHGVFHLDKAGGDLSDVFVILMEDVLRGDAMGRDERFDLKGDEKRKVSIATSTEKCYYFIRETI